MKEHVSEVNQCYIVDFDKNSDTSFDDIMASKSINIPFNVERVYYLYNVPGNESRGAHAHKELYQLVVAASGSFDVILDDGKNKKRFTLNRPNQGLFIVPGMWRDLENFSEGSVCLVLASMIYSEEDYIRDYDEFLRYKQQ